MSVINLSSYKKLYLQTAGEYCDSLLKNCHKILQNPKDTDALQNMYISSHSLRSQSQIMGYSRIESLSGMIEKTAKKFLDEKKSVPQDLMQAIQKSAEEIKIALKNMEGEK